MKQYKYSLDATSKKFACPKCNKKTFVKYVETITGNYLNDVFGRCDRESSCGYLNSPASEIRQVTQIAEVLRVPNFHSLELVEKSILKNHKNNFIQFLRTMFSENEVKDAVLKYLISNSKRWDGATTFWQIDNFERVHSGKILQYNLETGKRVKGENGKGLIDWVHSVLKRNRTLKEFNLHQCLFGLHLIKESDTNVVALVESEKTAIIMSVFKPEYVWLATGSKHGFRYDMLEPIKDFKIIAFPDKSEYNDWLKKAIELNGFCFNIIVNDWLEKTNYESGTDLADVFINEKFKQIIND